MQLLLTWLEPWEPSVVAVFVFAATAVAFLRGCRRRHTSLPRRLSFWLGLAVAYVGLHTHLDYYAEHQFFVHRLQHLGLHHLGPFLLALAYPGPVLRAGLPLSWRIHIVRPVMRAALVRWLLNVLLHPFVAPVLFVGLIFFWLYPPVHFDAMLDARLYKVMNWSMFVDGLMFWWLLLDARPSPPARMAPGVRVLVALGVMLPQILLGSYISFSHGDLYPIYDLCGRAFGGMSAQTDQMLGGLILWIPSSMMSVVAALLALSRWMHLSDRQRLHESSDTRHAAA